MSAVIVSIQDNCVVLAADGICYGEGGIVSGYMSKMHVLPHLNCVLTWTGMAPMGIGMLLMMGQHMISFDHLVEHFGNIAKATHERVLIEMPQQAEVSETTVMVAGWSEARQAFEAYRVMSYEKGTVSSDTGETTKSEPWTIYPVQGTWASFNPGADLLQEFGLADADGMQADEICIRFICASRARSGGADQVPSGRPFNCGGFLQVAILSKDQVDTWIEQRWPEDAIGRVIDPSLGARLPERILQLEAERKAASAG